MILIPFQLIKKYLFFGNESLVQVTRMTSIKTHVKKVCEVLLLFISVKIIIVYKTRNSQKNSQLN